MSGSFAERTFLAPQSASKGRPDPPPYTVQTPEDWLPRLQRAAGNQHLIRLLQGEDAPSTITAQERFSGPTDRTPRLLVQSGFGSDFRRVREHTDAEAARSAKGLLTDPQRLPLELQFGADLGGARLMGSHAYVRPSLGVSMSDPADHSERAAEAAASAVMAGALAPDATTGGETGMLARCSGGCGPVSCYDGGSASPTSSGAPAQGGGVANALAQPGAPLPPTTLRRMQAGFGADFSSVRVHHGPTAQEAARSVAARAFTIGNHIVFGANEYRPDSEVGQHLLAHELAHVVQQGFADPVASDRGSTGILPVAPPISRAPLGIYRAVETACLAPSEVPSVTTNQASELGRIVEAPIMMHYCAETACASFATDYFDTDSAASYIAFLAAHNPHLTPLEIVQLAIAATVLGGVFRPDILTHRPPRLEYEEIKPDSASGRAAGRAKQAGLAVLFARFSLPYAPGITWSGTGTLPLVVLPGPVEVFLEWHRNRSGLVVYNFCVRGEEAVLLAYGIAAIILAIILIILSRGKVLPPLPVPVPALAATGPAGQAEGAVASGEGASGVGLSSAGSVVSPGVATAGIGPAQSLG